jgi:D-glycero-D-manno-heptose 1,7-bisphosphate phosphatase
VHKDTEAHKAERLFFLDRDGTLNRTLGARPPNAPCEVELLPHVRPALSRYAAEGWRLVIVSNQGGVAAGFFSEAAAWAVQQRVLELLPVPVAASYLCPHAPDGTVPEYTLDCPNRKPRPGFLLAALERFGARARDCLFVGDSITDRQAAEAADVPYRWADRFFGRPIDRGLHTTDGRWVQIREAQLGELGDLEKNGPPGAQPERLLVAVMDKQIVGRLTIMRGEKGRKESWRVCVDPAYRGIGIEALLRDVLPDLGVSNHGAGSQPTKLVSARLEQ